MGFLKSKHAGEQDFELNLASIIDCFTLLIAYLLVSASFISLGVLDVSIIGPPVAQNTPPPEPTVNLSVFLGTNGAMTLKATGKEKMTVEIPASLGSSARPGSPGRPDSNDKPDFEALSHQLEVAKKRWPTVDSIQLAAAENSSYLYLVQAVETIKQQIPSVAIGEQDVE